MKKALLIIAGVFGVLGLLLLIIVGYVVSIQNGFATMDEEVNASWAQVENQLQRRYDLIPNLVNTVKGFAAQEKEVFTGIANARSRYSGARSPEEKIAASQQVESALSRLLMIVENYPQLKSDQSFIKLQDTLEGTENRIATERRRYNERVKEYNTALRKLPRGAIAKMLGFQPASFYQIDEAVREVPKVTF